MCRITELWESRYSSTAVLTPGRTAKPLRKWAGHEVLKKMATAECYVQTPARSYRRESLPRTYRICARWLNQFSPMSPPTAAGSYSASSGGRRKGVRQKCSGTSATCVHGRANHVFARRSQGGGSIGTIARLVRLYARSFRHSTNQEPGNNAEGRCRCEAYCPATACALGCSTSSSQCL